MAIELLGGCPQKCPKNCISYRENVPKICILHREDVPKICILHKTQELWYNTLTFRQRGPSHYLAFVLFATRFSSDNALANIWG